MNGLGSIAANAGEAGPFLFAFGALITIAAVGGMAQLLLTFIDEVKMKKMVTKATYIGCLGTVICMGLMVMNKVADALLRFIHILFG